MCVAMTIYILHDCEPWKRMIGHKWGELKFLFSYSQNYTAIIVSNMTITVLVIDNYRTRFGFYLSVQKDHQLLISV